MTELQNLKDANQHLENLIAAKAKEIELLKSQCAQLEKNCADLSAQSSSLISTTLGNAELELRIQNNTFEVTTLKQENATLKGHYDNEKGENDILREQLNGHKAMLEEVERKIPLLKEELRSYTEQNAALNRQIEQIRAEQGEKRIKKVVHDINSVSLFDISQQIVHDAEITELEKEIEKLTQEEGQVRDTLEESDRKVFSLNFKIQDFQGMVDKLEKKRDELRGKIDHLRQLNAESATNFKTLSVENRKLKGISTLADNPPDILDTGSTNRF